MNKKRDVHNQIGMQALRVRSLAEIGAYVTVQANSNDFDMATLAALFEVIDTEADKLGDLNEDLMRGFV